MTSHNTRLFSLSLCGEPLLPLLTLACAASSVLPLRFNLLWIVFSFLFGYLFNSSSALIRFRGSPRSSPLIAYFRHALSCHTTINHTQTALYRKKKKKLVMSSLLQTYEEDIKECFRRSEAEMTSIQATCRTKEQDYQPPPTSGPKSRIGRCSEMTHLFAHMRELLENMEYESHDIPAGHRMSLQTRMADYSQKLTKAMEQLHALKSSCGQADADDLVTSGRQRRGGEGEAGEDVDMEARRTLLSNTEKFRNASKTLNDAERVLNETEAVGSNALANLREQTEQLQGIQTITVAVDDEISESRKILMDVQRGIIKHKAILLAIIFVLILLIILAIYVTATKNRSSTPVTPTPSTTPVPLPTYLPTLSPVWVAESSSTVAPVKIPQPLLDG